MTSPKTRPAAVLLLTLCLGISLLSCRRLRVGGDIEDIEWVIITCHTEGFPKPWVSRLTPKENGGLIRELLDAIHSARWKGGSGTAGDGFIVFKLKGSGIRSYNFAPWEPGGEVEIRPGFRSKDLARLLTRIGDEEAGWRRGDSIPGIKVRAIEVWQYGRTVTEFAADSSSFAPLLAAVSEVLKAFDPRLCMPNLARRDPRQVALYQGAPQFVVLLEEPLDMYKLVVWWRIDDPDVPQVRYERFRSSAIMMYMERFEDRIGFHYVAFQSDRETGTRYDWEVTEGSEAAKAIGKPDARQAFESLLDAYNQLAGS